MNAHEHQVLTPEQRRQINREHAMYEVLGLTTDGLRIRTEQDIREAVMRHIDPILDLADAATAAAIELQALDRRLEHHFPGCTTCEPMLLCSTYWEQRRRRDILERRWDAAYRALMAGRQR